jgi:hypothetical protein
MTKELTADNLNDAGIVAEEINAADHVVLGSSDVITENVSGEAVENEAEDEVLLGDSPAAPPAPAPAWVKSLRSKYKALAAENAALKGGAVQRTDAPASAGPKPTLAEFDFDSDQFEQAYDHWAAKQSAIKDGERSVAERQAQEQRAWQSQIGSFEAQVKALPFRDALESVDAAQAEFTPLQASVIIQYAENPALLMMALGRNLEKAAELSRVTDPIKFALEIKKVESTMSTKPRKPSTSPERVILSGAGKVGAILAGGDKRRDALIAEASKTGDMRPLQQYDRAAKNKSTA